LALAVIASTFGKEPAPDGDSKTGDRGGWCVSPKISCIKLVQETSYTRYEHDGVFDKPLSFTFG
jgi:hypothetical protein